MSNAAERIDVVDDRGRSRYCVDLDQVGHAEIDYRVDGDRMVITHTEVPDELEGRGIGSMLVRAAIERAKRDDLTVVPACPFARAWLEKHPDEASAVDIDWGR